MSSTLNPVCPLCGLRFASKPLLELHIREDHRPRRRMQPGRADADGAEVSSAAAGRPSGRPGLASGPDRGVQEVTATTAARPRRGRVVTVPRRVLRALRHVNDELMRASEAIIRSARAPQSRPQTQAPAARDTHPDTAAERADRAAWRRQVPSGQGMAGPVARVAATRHQQAVGYPPGQTEGSPAAGPDAGTPAEQAPGTARAG